VIRPSRRNVLLAGSLVLLCTAPSRAGAQQGPLIDSIHIEVRNIFNRSEAERSFLFRLTNAVHVPTRAYVVRRELLFREGEPYDAARLAETERNLRRLGIFRDVTIDTVRVDGRLIARVTTSDGWSTNLSLNAKSTGGVVTWAVALTEQNLLGTANSAGVSYRREVDRDALRVQARVNRIVGSRLIAEGYYDDLSDGRVGSWSLAVPYRALGDREAVELRGEAADARVLRFRTTRNRLDTTAFQHTALVQRATVSYAPLAGSDGYVRVGVTGQIRREAFVLQADTALAVSDSVSGAVGLLGEWFRPRFTVVTHYNGFARDEDVDLGTKVAVAVWVAPHALGYDRGGVVPSIDVRTGAAAGRAFARVRARAHGLFTTAGLDSGLVAGSVTLASQLIQRQATVVHVEAGMQKNPVPAAEFDLGHGFGPRSLAPHSFTGTRTVWGTIEHRAFLVDDVAGLLGIGLAGFVDYGGAWYANQAARFAGNVGLGLRLGTTRSTGPNVGRFDLAYQFGDGMTGNRWVFSFGRSYEF